MDAKDKVLLSSMEEMASREGQTLGDFIKDVPEAKVTSRSLRQEELDGYYRYAFVKDVIEYIDTMHTAKFIVHSKDTGKFRIIEISKRLDGEWSFSISGKGSFYTYRYADVIHILEKAWDAACEMIFLDGEIQPTFSKPVCNADAEPDTIVEK